MNRVLLACASLMLGGCFNFTRAVFSSGTKPAPQLALSSPSDGAEGVPVGDPLHLYFSQAMNEDSLVVTADPPIALIAFGWQDDGTHVTFAPEGEWAAETTYTIAFDAVGVEGAALVGAKAIAFTTGAPTAVFNDPPVIVGTVPPNGAVSVAAASALSVRFNHAMVPSSIVVTTAPQHTLGVPSASDGDTLFSFSPPESFIESTAYQVLVTGTDTRGLEAAGGFSFSTANLSSPSVLTTVPVHGSQSFPTNQSIAITFSEPMNPATATPSSVVLTLVGGGQRSCDLAWTNNATQLLCTPNPALVDASDYTLVLSTALADAGTPALPLAAPLILTFRAGPPDVTAPALSGPAEPSAYAENVPIAEHTAPQRGVHPDANLVFTFSEQLSNLDGKLHVFEDVIGPGGPSGVSGTLTGAPGGNGGYAYTFNPASSFNYGAVVSWTMDPGVTDLAHLPLAPYSVSQKMRIIAQETVSATAATAAGHIRFLGGAYSANTTATILGVGDDNSAGAYRAFIEFYVPWGAPTKIVSAQLTLFRTSVTGTPYTWNGPLRLQSVSFGAVPDEGTEMPPTNDYRTPFDAGGETTQVSDGGAGLNVFDVTATVQWCLSVARSHPQWRLKHDWSANCGNGGPCTEPKHSGSAGYTRWASGLGIPSLRPKLDVTFQNLGPAP